MSNPDHEESISRYQRRSFVGGGYPGMTLFDQYARLRFWLGAMARTRAMERLPSSRFRQAIEAVMDDVPLKLPFLTAS
jgi:hypothetical protein